MVEKIVVLGATGSVGKQVVEDIINKDGPDSGHENPSIIVGMANSKGLIFNPEGIIGAEDLVQNREHFNVSVTHPYTEGTDMAETLIDAFRQAGVLGEILAMDVTALKGEQILKVHQQLLATNNRMVTANKNALALSPNKQFQELAGFPMVYNYSPTVMAGGGAISWLRQCKNIGETVHRIEGMFSGTMGFICSKLDEGYTLSQSVREAYEKGYTEPHPHDDLNGLDVLRKLVILPRTAGFDVSAEDVLLEGLVSDDLYRKDVEAYFQLIEKEVDGRIEQVRQEALKEEKKLRFVAEFDNTEIQPKMNVGLKAVESNSPLGRLSGTDNLVNIFAQERAPNGHVIVTPGAGIERTAGEVRAAASELILGGANVYGAQLPKAMC